MGHKVYEISVKGHSYHFFALKKIIFPKKLIFFIFLSFLYLKIGKIVFLEQKNDNYVLLG